MTPDTLAAKGSAGNGCPSGGYMEQGIRLALGAVALGAFTLAQYALIMFFLGY